MPWTWHWSPICQTAGPARCVCWMAAPGQEENHSCAVTEGASGKGDAWRLASLSPERGFPEGLATQRYRPSRKWSGDPRSSLTCQYCPHHACVLRPGLQSLTGGVPGGSGSDSHHETCGEVPSRLGRELNVSRSGVHFLTFRTSAQKLLRSGCCL